MWLLGDTIFLFSCWKVFYLSLHSVMKYCLTLEGKFQISMLPCNILYLCTMMSHVITQDTLRATVLQTVWTLKTFDCNKANQKENIKVMKTWVKSIIMIKIYSHPEEFCRTMWSTSFVLFANIPPHVTQAKIFSLVWLRQCSLSL